MEISLVADTIYTPFSLYKFPIGSPQISAAVAPPPLKSNHLKTARRILVQRRRRTRRRSDSDGYDDGFYGGGNGPYGSGGGGRGWNSGGGSFGWSNWEWDGPSSPADPAFDFVYEVMCWIALSNCLHFAFKKVIRVGGDPEREKLRLASVC